MARHQMGTCSAETDPHVLTNQSRPGVGVFGFKLTPNPLFPFAFSLNATCCSTALGIQSPPSPPGIAWRLLVRHPRAGPLAAEPHRSQKLRSLLKCIPVLFFWGGRGGLPRLPLQSTTHHGQVFGNVKCQNEKGEGKGGRRAAAFEAKATGSRCRRLKCHGGILSSGRSTFTGAGQPLEQGSALECHSRYVPDYGPASIKMSKDNNFHLQKLTSVR